MYLRFNMIVLLILSGHLAFADWERFEQLDESQSRYYIEQFKDKSKFKEFLMRGEFMWAKEMLLFKSKFKISDELMRTVSMEIYSETMDKIKKGSQVNNAVASQEDQKLLLISVGWMGTIADNNTKTFLLGLATVASTDRGVKKQAISSYLYAADPEEAKNALLRFLVEGDRMDYMGRLSIYEYARMAYVQANESKRAAILSALYIAVFRAELTPWEFRDCDDILVKLSPEYSKSNERFALLQKHNAASYPKLRERTKNEVKDRLEIMRKLKNFTSISTNLAALKSRNFNLPQPDLATNELLNSVSNSVSSEFVKIGDDSNDRTGTLVLLSCTVLALLGFGVWKFMKK